MWNNFHITKYFLFFSFFLAQQPPVGQGLLIHEVSRSQTTTYHSLSDSSRRVISSSQKPLPNNTQHSQQTHIHTPAGIRTHNLSRWAAADYALNGAATGTGKTLCSVSNFGLKESERNLLELEAIDFGNVTFWSYSTHIKIIWASRVTYCRRSFIVSSQNVVQMAKCEVCSHIHILRKFEENSNEIIKENSYSFFSSVLVLVLKTPNPQPDLI
jgi:hypothetical protein